MVLGKWAGSLNTAELLWMNSCGTFFSFMYGRIARLGSVPKELKISRTSCCSTNLAGAPPRQIARDLRAVVLG